MQVQLDEYWSCRCGGHTYSPTFVYAIRDLPEEKMSVEESRCDECSTGPTFYFKRTRYTHYYPKRYRNGRFSN